jgi:hypothetical protein
VAESGVVVGLRGSRLSPVPVAPAVARGLRVAVRAQDLEILQSVIAIVSVDVVESHVQRLAAPLGYSTELTPVLLEALLHQPPLEVVAAALRSVVK